MHSPSRDVLYTTNFFFISTSSFGSQFRNLNHTPKKKYRFSLVVASIHILINICMYLGWFSVLGLCIVSWCVPTSTYPLHPPPPPPSPFRASRWRRWPKAVRADFPPGPSGGDPFPPRPPAHKRHGAMYVRGGGGIMKHAPNTSQINTLRDFKTT